MTALQDRNFARRKCRPVTSSSPHETINFHRWYDSTVGIWISEDPIGFKSQEQNLSRYVRNAALIGIDPAGLKGRLRAAAGPFMYVPSAVKITSLGDPHQVIADVRAGLISASFPSDGRTIQLNSLDYNCNSLHAA